MASISTPAPQASLRTSETLVFASPVSEDDGVTALDKKFKAIEVEILLVVSIISLISGFCIFVLGWGYYSPQQSELSRWITRCCAGFFLTVNSVVGFLYNHKINKDYRAERRYMRGSIASSRKIAHSLGADKVPVLTKEHVEKRVQIDTALKDKLDAQGKQWDQSESDSIAILLFQDLLIEPVLMSLISERALVTSADISSALQQMESESVKPIQDGWL